MAENQITVRLVESAKAHHQFLDLPYQLYKHHPYWVPPLRMAQKDILNIQKHPFYKAADVELFLAFRNEKPVGRIMAIVNHAANQFHHEQAGHFGFFECENNFVTAQALFDAARHWLRERGMTVMRGPFNPSTNYECALLVQGFDSSPTVMMPYNFDYYAALFEQYGFTKAMDLMAYDISLETFNYSEKLGRVAERLKNKYRIKVRTIDLKKFASEVETVRRIYNDAWSNNWGFVPVSDDEFQHIAKDLKQIVDSQVVFVAEQLSEDGKTSTPIAFFLAIPDINLALKKVTDGRLLPFGLIKLLWHSRKIDFIRIVTMGVVKDHQNLGIAAVFYDEIYKHAAQVGKYPKGEMSWILENNLMMNRSAELIGGKIAKVYRIYEKSIGD
ncbi:MAG: N-acetyltransferase [Acidobacteriota bacterium]